MNKLTKKYVQYYNSLRKYVCVHVLCASISKYVLCATIYFFFDKFDELIRM